MEDADEIEGSNRPHAGRDDEQRVAFDQEGDAAHAPDERRLQFTRKDLDRYGFSENCPRCSAIENGDYKTKRNHTEACRQRIYAQM